MLTRRTIEAAVTATLESLHEANPGSPTEIANLVIAEEAFAELAVHQMLKCSGDGLRARSGMAGYQGLSVARQLLDAFDSNWNRWEPIMSLTVADAALAIARRSGRRTPALLFRVHKECANAKRALDLFEPALRSLDDAEEFASDTNSKRLHFALLANNRASVYCEMGRVEDALPLLMEAREGFSACGESEHFRTTLMIESGICFGLGRFEDARRLNEDALASAESCNDEAVSAIIHGNLAICLARIGDVEAARRSLRAAEASFAARGWVVLRTKVLAALARLEVREYGLARIGAVNRACIEYDRLRMFGDVARFSLAMAEEILAIDPSADVTELCRLARTRAMAIGLDQLAMDAQILAETSRSVRHRPM